MSNKGGLVFIFTLPGGAARLLAPRQLRTGDHKPLLPHQTGTISGVSRVWQAWHMPWAPLWRGVQKFL